MGTKVEVVYDGNLECVATHPASGATFKTAAPEALGGTGKGYTPGDVVGAALGSCMMTYLGVVAKTSNLNVDGMKCEVDTEMGTDPHRIMAMKVTLTMPASCATFTPGEKAKLVNSSKLCPVKHSLLADIKIDVEFIWPTA